MRKTKGTNLIMIRTENLFPHPDNPRLDVGDVSELAESVAKNGIMQNLTVIPEEALTLPPEEQKATYLHEADERYIVLIGHRRLAAAKAAGVEEVPCKVVSKISKREQVSIMLEENMQRSDLTIYEEANGFQMMLDLGETAETIAEKTGFSKTTVNHRLNIAKLDRDTLREKVADSSFQLSFTDLYELEKIKDIEVRNNILKKSSSSNAIIALVANEIENEKRRKAVNKVMEILKKEGICKATEKEASERRKPWYEIVKQFYMGDSVPEVVLPQNDTCEGALWFEQYNWITIFRRKPGFDADAWRAAKENEKKERQALDKRNDELRKMARFMREERRLFLRTAINNTLVPDPQVRRIDDTREEVLRILLKDEGGWDRDDMAQTLMGKNSWHLDEAEEAQLDRLLEDTPTIYLLLAAMEGKAGAAPGYFTDYDRDDWKLTMKLEGILKDFGFSYSDPELYKVSNGTHELYKCTE